MNTIDMDKDYLDIREAVKDRPMPINYIPRYETDDGRFSFFNGMETLNYDVSNRWPFVIDLKQYYSGWKIFFNFVHENPYFKKGTYQLILTPEKMNKVRHELFCWYLTGKWFESDVKLETLGIQNSSLARQSPDVIETSGRSVFILEVATSASTRLEERVNEKVEKYRDAVTLLREDRPVMLDAIVFAQDRYCFTGNALKNTGELSELWRMASIIETLAVREGFEPKFFGEFHVLENKLLLQENFASKNNVLKDNQPSPIIDIPMHENWKRGPTKSGLTFLSMAINAATEAFDAASKSKPDDKKFRELEDKLKLESEENDKYGQSKVRSDMKSFIPFPIFSLDTQGLPWSRDERYTGVEFPVLNDYDEENQLYTIWRDGVTDANINYTKFNPYTKRDLVELAMLDKMEYYERVLNGEKIRRNRVGFVMSDAQKVYLKSRGVYSKNDWSSDAEAQKIKAKKPFLLSTNTDDIETYVNGDIGAKALKSRAMYSERSDWQRKMTYGDEIDKLINVANIDNCVDNSVSEYKAFCATEVSQALSISDLIHEEVNLSLNQFCRRNKNEVEMVIKKIINLPIYLLCRSIGATKPISFSVFIDKTKLSKVDKKINLVCGSKKISFENDECAIFDFCTMNRHKLSHYLNSNEQLFALYKMWSELYREDMIDSLKSDEPSEVKSHFLSTLLFHLESKAQTGTSAQAIRFGYMECVKLAITPPDPFKTFDKMTDRPKSRLLVWFFNKVRWAYNEMIRNPVMIDDNSGLNLKAIKQTADADISRLVDPKQNLSRNNFRNLKSWVTGNDCHRFDVTLNLSYYGVLHNKDEGDQVQSDTKIYSKVVGEEIKLEDARPEYMGHEDLDEIPTRSHEFSKSYLLHAGRNLKRILTTKKGDFDAFLMQQLAIKVADRNCLTLATFKSSALYIPDNVTLADILPHDVDGVKKKEFLLTRQKVFENIFSELDKDVLSMEPYNRIDYLVSLVEDRGGVQANMFKKLQIGGPREIFVLDIISRVIISFMETISRIICTEVDGETLSKGTQKNKISDDHFRIVDLTSEQTKNPEIQTCINSDDSKTWCQKFVMPAFGAVLHGLLEENMFVMCARILNCVTNKKILISPSLLKQFIDPTKNEIKSFDENINEMKRQFKNEHGPHNLVDHEGIFLTNRSNMMQGICHFTSSLTHIAHKLFAKRLIEIDFNERIHLHKTIPYGSVLIETNKVSSDDSSVIRTIVSPKCSDQERMNIRMYLELLSYFDGEVCKFASINRSYEKSTYGASSMIEEYNSTWFVSNSIVSPVIKFVYAACHPKTVQKISERLSTYANLRKQITENGGSQSLAAAVQIAQLVIHYCVLGLRVNGIFRDYSKLLCKRPSPSFGFFPVEPEFLCGVLGMDFAYYNQYQGDENCRIIESSLFSQVDSEPDSDLRIAVVLSLMIGNNKNYQTFLDKIKLKSSYWREELNDKPGLLFRRPDDVDEMKLLLYKKSVTPGVEESFSFQTSSKLSAAAVYSISTPAITGRIKQDDGEFKREKKSLYRFLRELPLDKENNALTDMLFPYKGVFDEILDITRSFRGSHKIHKEYYLPKKFLIMGLPKISAIAPISILSWVKSTWFSDRREISKTVKEMAYKSFILVFPWLRWTLEESFEAAKELGVFKDKIAMCDYLKSIDPRTKTLRVLAPVSRSRNMLSQLTRLISVNYLEGFMQLNTIPLPKKQKDEIDHVRMSSELLLAMNCGVIDQKHREFLAESIILEKKSPFKNEVLSASTKLATMSEGDAALSIILLQIKKEMRFKGNNDELEFTIPIEPLLTVIKRDVYGYFDVPQSFKYDDDDKIEFYGKGGYFLKMNGVICHLDIFDNKIRGLEVSDLEAFKKNIRIFKEHLVEISINEVDEKGKSNFIKSMRETMENPNYRKLNLESNSILEFHKNKTSHGEIIIVESKKLADRRDEMILIDKNIYVSYERDAIKLKYKSYRTTSEIFDIRFNRTDRRYVSTTLVKFRFNRYNIDPDHLNPLKYGKMDSKLNKWMSFKPFTWEEYMNELSFCNRWDKMIIPKARSYYNQLKKLNDKVLRGGSRKELEAKLTEVDEKIGESAFLIEAYGQDKYKRPSVEMLRDFEADEKFIDEKRLFLVKCVKNSYNLKYKQNKITSISNQNLEDWEDTKLFNIKDFERNVEAAKDVKTIDSVNTDDFMRFLENNGMNMQSFTNQTRPMSNLFDSDKILEKHPVASRFLTKWIDDEKYLNENSDNVQFTLFTDYVLTNPTDLSRLMSANIALERTKYGDIEEKKLSYKPASVPVFLDEDEVLESEKPRSGLVEKVGETALSFAEEKDLVDNEGVDLSDYGFNEEEFYASLNEQNEGQENPPTEADLDIVKALATVIGTDLQVNNTNASTQVNNTNFNDNFLDSDYEIPEGISEFQFPEDAKESDPNGLFDVD